MAVRVIAPAGDVVIVVKHAGVAVASGKLHQGAKTWGYAGLAAGVVSPADGKARVVQGA